MTTTNGLRVSFYDRPAADLFGDEPLPIKLHGTLTIDHATSSYGMPVVVGDDGTVYGPADLLAGDCRLSDTFGSAHQFEELVAAARRAGFAL